MTAIHERLAQYGEVWRSSQAAPPDLRAHELLMRRTRRELPQRVRIAAAGSAVLAIAATAVTLTRMSDGDNATLAASHPPRISAYLEIDYNSTNANGNGLEHCLKSYSVNEYLDALVLPARVLARVNMSQASFDGLTACLRQTGATVTRKADQGPLAH